MSKQISVVTLVNNEESYRCNVIRSIGLYSDDLIPIHASSATKGLNLGISKARHEIVVVCHQDVIFPDKWVDTLFSEIERIKNPNFGVLGTFGRDLKLECAGNILNPRPFVRKAGILPCEALSLDEHCLILKKSNGLKFDEKLKGFHCYGGDLCLTARKNGMKNYVIDAQLEHLSAKGTFDFSFEEAVCWMITKWRRKTDIKVFRTMCYEANLLNGSYTIYG